jgi:CRISPR-associated protein Cmr6
MTENTRRIKPEVIPLLLDESRLATLSPNAGLWLDKFIISPDGDTKVPNLKRGRKEITAKARLVEEVATIPVPKEYDQFYDRWVKGLEKLRAIKQPASLQGRMAVGLGDESALETSVTLHRTYGVPYIPGSALKGLAASFARNRLGNKHWDKGGYAYKVVFGATEEAGYISFHDALYVPGSGNKRPLRADVITVHHPDYYQNNKDAAPADWDDPNPVPFLSATGDYLVAISAAPDCQVWLSQTWRILRLALKDEGIGAKTSSGYGRMSLKEQ